MITEMRSSLLLAIAKTEMLYTWASLLACLHSDSQVHRQEASIVELMLQRHPSIISRVRRLLDSPLVAFYAADR